MILFLDEDRAYLSWVTHHRNGFVLDCHRKPNKHHLMLHRAICPDIKRSATKTTHWTTGHHMKACSLNLLFAGSGPEPVKNLGLIAVWIALEVLNGNSQSQLSFRQQVQCPLETAEYLFPWSSPRYNAAKPRNSVATGYHAWVKSWHLMTTRSRIGRNETNPSSGSMSGLGSGIPRSAMLRLS